jgi:hypothetical protein
LFAELGLQETGLILITDWLVDGRTNDKSKLPSGHLQEK